MWRGGGHKKEETKKQGERAKERWVRMSLPQQQILKLHPPSPATFTLIPVCANPGQVEIEFDEREIDSQASDAGVRGSCGGDEAGAERHAITPT